MTKLAPSDLDIAQSEAGATAAEVTTQWEIDIDDDSNFAGLS